MRTFPKKGDHPGEEGHELIGGIFDPAQDDGFCFGRMMMVLFCDKGECRNAGFLREGQEYGREECAGPARGPGAGAEGGRIFATRGGEDKDMR